MTHADAQTIKALLAFIAIMVGFIYLVVLLK